MAADNGEPATLAVDHHHWGAPGSLHGSRRKALSAQCAHWAPPPKGEARRRAAAFNYESVTLAVDPRHWGSPGSLQLSDLDKGKNWCFLRRAGACPRRPREFTAAPTKFHRTKAFPLGGRWLAVGETDEERRNLPKRMHPNKTHLTWLSLWESWHGAAVTERGGRHAAAVNGESATLAVDHHHWGSPGSLHGSRRKALSAQCAHWAPLPKGEARRRKPIPQLSIQKRGGS